MNIWYTINEYYNYKDYVRRYIMRNTYETPLNRRYASSEMSYLFSDEMKFKTWRKLWVALAESEMELGLNITQDQVDELKSSIVAISERLSIIRAAASPS